MPIQRDFKEYHKSIAKELLSTKDRVRNLIGDAHWLTEGEHKEAVLRKILRQHLPEDLHVGRGFICSKDGSSSQIDILITSKKKPTLFKDGELVIVTPDTVECIIEVKTSLGTTRLSESLTKLSDNAQMVRSEGNTNCKAGLFVYQEGLNHEEVLSRLNSSANGRKKKAINWVSIGPNDFFRYWEKGSGMSSPVDGSVWHSYRLDELSHAYFISNVVWDVSRGNSLKMQFAWFPIEGGKERYRKWYVPLASGVPSEFNH